MTNIIPVAEVQTMAVAIAKSGLFGVKTPDQALALMLICQAEGLHPAIAARDYDIIQGRPAKKAEAMLRSFLEAGGKVEWHQLDDKIADATFSHAQGGSVRISWDMERGKQAGLASKDMWKKFPRQMLRSRCISEGVRTVYPSATSGMLAPEEAQDIGGHSRTVPRGATVIDQQALPAPTDDAQTQLLARIENATEAELADLRTEIGKLPKDSAERKQAIEAGTRRAAALKERQPEPEQQAEPEPDANAGMDDDPI